MVPSTLLERTLRNLSYPVTQDDSLRTRIDRVRASCKKLAIDLDANCPEGYFLQQSLQALETACQHAMRGIAGQKEGSVSQGLRPLGPDGLPRAQ